MQLYLLLLRSLIVYRSIIPSRINFVTKRERGRDDELFRGNNSFGETIAFNGTLRNTI